MRSKIKNIELESKDIKTLVELMFRGLAYTDAYYRDYKRMNGVYNKIQEQLESQGVVYGINGEVHFRNY